MKYTLKKAFLLCTLVFQASSLYSATAGAGAQKPTQRQLEQFRLLIYDNNTAAVQQMIQMYPGITKNSGSLLTCGDSMDGVIVNELLKDGANVNDMNSEDKTALFKAAQIGDSERVYILLAAGANPNIGERNRATAIEIIKEAMQRVNAERAKLVVDSLHKGPSQQIDLRTVAQLVTEYAATPLNMSAPQLASKYAIPPYLNMPGRKLVSGHAKTPRHLNMPVRELILDCFRGGIDPSTIDLVASYAELE